MAIVLGVHGVGAWWLPLDLATKQLHVDTRILEFVPSGTRQPGWMVGRQCTIEHQLNWEPFGCLLRFVAETRIIKCSRCTCPRSGSIARQTEGDATRGSVDEESAREATIGCASIRGRFRKDRHNSNGPCSVTLEGQWVADGLDM